MQTFSRDPEEMEAHILLPNSQEERRCYLRFARRKQFFEDTKDSISETESKRCAGNDTWPECWTGMERKCYEYS